MNWFENENISEILHCVYLDVKKEVGDNYTHPGTEVFNNCEIDEDYEYGYEEEQEYFMVSNVSSCGISYYIRWKPIDIYVF